MNCTTNRKLNKSSRTLLVCLFWLVIWQVAAIVVGNDLLLPDVFDTLVAIGSLAQDSTFYLDVSWTLFRCIISIVLSFIAGICFAWLAYKNEIVRNIMTLPVSFFKAVPVMAIVVYVILLVRADWVAVAACFLMCFPIVYTNILAGLEDTSKELLEMVKVYGIEKGDKVRLVYIPSSMPHFNAAMKIVAGLSWKAVVAAEVLSVPEFSLGQGMISAKYYLETPTLFAYIFVIVVLSLTLEKAICMLTDRFTMANYEGSKLTKLKKVATTVMGPPDINIRDLFKSFDDKEVFRGLNAFIKAGCKAGVIGPSGRGKTTLARILSGLEREYDGLVEFSEEAKVSYLFQEDRLLPWFNVYDNMALVVSSNCDLTYDRVVQMAKALEIEEILWKMPQELSGGMKHRVAIGRTLLADSNLLILDEPFRGLDEDLKKRIVDRLWDKYTKDKTVVVISHNEKDLELIKIDDTMSIGVE